MINKIGKCIIYKTIVTEICYVSYAYYKLPSLISSPLDFYVKIYKGAIWNQIKQPKTSKLHTWLYFTIIQLTVENVPSWCPRLHFL